MLQDEIDTLREQQEREYRHREQEAKDRHQVLRNLHGPLCEIFWGTIPDNVKFAVNSWIEGHPNAFIEQQDVAATQDELIIVIWYTEDSDE